MDVVCFDAGFQFFGVNSDLTQYIRFFDDEKDLQVLMNDVISKPRAIEKALELFEGERNQYANLYVSHDALECGRIRDCWGDLIFPDVEEDISGWLFLFDPTPYANWGHDCKYLLLVDDNSYMMKEYNRGASDIVLLEEIF